MSYSIRKATIQDCSLILTFIKELAGYLQLEEKVVGTVDLIKNTLFPAVSTNVSKTEVIIIEEGQTPVGFALYFYNYSTFLCRHGIYIEDLYVRQKYRGKGYGKALLKHICSLAVERNCGLVEWLCSDRNKLAIDFYLALGAEAVSDWTVYRFSNKEIQEMADLVEPHEITDA